MSVMAIVALVATILVISGIKSLETVVSEMEQPLSTEGLIVVNFVYTALLIFGISIWPSFVLVGLVTAPIGVTLSMQLGILLVTYMMFN